MQRHINNEYVGALDKKDRGKSDRASINDEMSYEVRL